jgi:hypothetical protein
MFHQAKRSLFLSHILNEVPDLCFHIHTTKHSKP